MPTTTPWGIPYPDGFTNLTALQSHFANIANAVNSALTTGLGGAPRIANSDAERLSIFPAPTQGNTVVRPDLGTTEQYYGLYSASTNPGGATPAGWYPVSGLLPAFRGAKSAAQSFATGAGVLLTYEIAEVFGGVTHGSGVVTVATPGWYRITGRIGSFSTNGGSDRWYYITKNSTGTTGQVAAATTSGGANVFGLISTGATVPLAAGDTIRANALQNSGASATLSEAYLSVEFVAPRK